MNMNAHIVLHFKKFCIFFLNEILNNVHHIHLGFVKKIETIFGKNIILHTLSLWSFLNKSIHCESLQFTPMNITDISMCPSCK